MCVIWMTMPNLRDHRIYVEKHIIITNDWLIMLISNLIMLIGDLIMLISQNLLQREAGTVCLILMCDTWKLARNLCRFQICIEKYQFPNSKKVQFLPYANFCQVGNSAVISFYYAEPSTDQMCRFFLFFFLWGYLLRNRESRAPIDPIILLAEISHIRIT